MNTALVFVQFGMNRMILVEPVVAAGWPGSPPGAVCDAAHTAMTRVNSNT